MLINYFKIAYRTLAQQKGYTVLTVLGLAVGMACCGALTLFVLDELGHNGFHRKKDRLHWVWNRTLNNGKLEAHANTPNVMAETLLEAIPEVAAAARADHGGEYTLRTGGKVLRAQGRIVDPAFLSMFTFPLRQGNVNTALAGTNSILLIESLARSLFNTTEAMGKTLLLDNAETMTVTGVLQDVPANSGLQFDLLIPWRYYEKRQPWVGEKTWGSNAFLTFVELKPGAAFNAVDRKVNRLFDQYSNEKGYRNEYFLHPLTKWHLYNEFKGGYASGGNIDFIRLFAWMAFGIMLIACINFMNLATARSMKRAKEVGIGKVAGASRGSLIGQFLSESVLVAAASLALAILLTHLLLPPMNALTDEQLRIDYQNPSFWLVALGVTLLVGLLAGSYPALYLSGFRPIGVLKGVFIRSRAGQNARQVLVVSQFAFSAGLIVATGLIYQQIELMRNRPAGYDRDKLVYAWLEGDLEKNFALIREEAMQRGLIDNASLSQHAITNDYHSSQNISWPGKPVDQVVEFDLLRGDDAFLSTHRVQLLHGRDFSPAFDTDSSAVLLNETAVKVMGLQQPLGATIQFWGKPCQIIGVFRDFIWGEVSGRIPPMLVVAHGLPNYVMTLRLTSAKPTSGALAGVQQVIKKHNPAYPAANFFFIDQAYQAKYRAELIVGKLAASFALLAVFVACLGLFGLAAYTAEQRTKEMGIRKILGATFASLWFTLSKDFLKLTFLALLLGWPLAWYGMQQWLERYEVHTRVSWWLFPLTGAVLLTTTFLTVSVQAIKAALTNPARSLRNE
jgi:ABC-type antimicrobial peptide transport system permease subunit